MMKLKRLTVFVLTVMLAAGFLFNITGCGNSGISDDPKTLNIRIYKAGYGDAYIKAMAAKFEEIYYEEGYKVNVVESAETVLGAEVVNELMLGDKNRIDMYFSGGFSATDMINKAEEKGYDLVEDLSDIYKMHPITLTGEEETEKTIEEKIDPMAKKYMQYVGSNEEYYGKYLFFPLYKSPTSLVINKKVLKDYEIDVPLTTNQLVAAVNKIAETSETTGVYPVSWAGLNAYTYWHCCEDLWMAQYEGEDRFLQTITMNGFENPLDAVQVYDWEGYKHSLTVMDTMLDLDNTARGTINMGHGNAQHLFITGKAAFMANSGWLHNEMSANYSQYMDDIVMIKMPIISELGVKLGLDGKNGTDRAKCEEVLIDIIAGIDAGKSDAEIVADAGTANSVTVEPADVAAVRDARYLMYDRGVTNQAIISNFSTKKDIAKLFLRMFASDDSGQYLLTFANATSPFILNTELDYSASSEFVKSAMALCDSEYTGLNRAFSGESLRQDALVELFYGDSAPEKTIASGDGAPGTTGAELWKKTGDEVKKIWEKTLRENNLI